MSAVVAIYLVGCVLAAAAAGRTQFVAGPSGGRMALGWAIGTVFLWPVFLAALAIVILWVTFSPDWSD